MTQLNRQDADLHDENGEHRSTPATTNGTALANYERRLRAHLVTHQDLLVQHPSPKLKDQA